MIFPKDFLEILQILEITHKEFLCQCKPGIRRRVILFGRYIRDILFRNSIGTIYTILYQEEDTN